MLYFFTVSLFSGRKPPKIELTENEFTDELESRCHGIASKLEGKKGTSVVLPGNRIPYIYNEYEGIASPETDTRLTKDDFNGRVNEQIADRSFDEKGRMVMIFILKQLLF